MEKLNEIWQLIAPYVTGISVSGIIAAVIYGCLKGAFSKTINTTVGKINVEKISEQATDKGIEKIKNISFTQSIQPLVESELKKITEAANQYINTALNKTQEQYTKLITVLQALAAYFDNSIGVSEEAKQQLRTAIESAESLKIKPETVENIIVEEVAEKQSGSVVTANIEAKSEDKKVKSTVMVER